MLYVIGRQSCDKSDVDTYCNGVLRHTSEYCIKLRAYVNDQYVDSPCAYVTDNKSKFFTYSLLPICY